MFPLLRFHGPGLHVRLDRKENIRFGDVKEEIIKTNEIAEEEAFLCVEPWNWSRFNFPGQLEFSSANPPPRRRIIRFLQWLRFASMKTRISWLSASKMGPSFCTGRNNNLRFKICYFISTNYFVLLLKTPVKCRSPEKNGYHQMKNMAIFFLSILVTSYRTL